MASAIGSIIRQATRKKEEKFNILSYVTHERYSSCQAGCNANFYLYQNGVSPGQQDFVKGDWIKSYAEIPRNHQILPRWQNNPLEVIPAYVDIDLVFAQHRFGQAQQGLELAKHLGLPTVILEHTTITNENLRQAAPELKKLRGNMNVFISESSALAWGWDLDDPGVAIVYHGVDTDLFKPSLTRQDIQPHILCVVNDWRNRGDILGWDIFERVCGQNHLPVRILGDNKGISQPAPNIYALAQAYREAAVFYNTSRHSPIPTVILEAMACETPVVSTDNYLISEIIVNGVNGYKTNSETEQLKYLRELLNDPAQRKELGTNARKTILERFPLSNFINNWNNIFNKVINK